MLLISHRGNISGRNPERENTLPYIREAIDTGYCVEIDVRGGQGELFSGHDNSIISGPKISFSFLDSYFDQIFLHAKNQEAARILSEESFRFFCHSEEDFVATSRGDIITHSRLGAQKGA